MSLLRFECAVIVCDEEGCPEQLMAFEDEYVVHFGTPGVGVDEKAHADYLSDIDQGETSWWSDAEGHHRCPFHHPERDE